MKYITNNAIIPDIKHHVLPALTEVLLLSVVRVPFSVPTAVHLQYKVKQIIALDYNSPEVICSPQWQN